MPVLTSLSLLSTVSGAMQAAGQVVDALHSAKSSSTKKPDPPNQTQDKGQLVNLFAACLAAAAHSPTGQAALSAPSSNVPQKGAANSIKAAAASLSSLSMVLALGPTTAITASLALHPAKAGGIPSSKTAQNPAIAKGTTSTLPSAANALHTTAKQTSAPVTKIPSPTKATPIIRTASVSDRNASFPVKGTQNSPTAGRQTAESSPAGAIPPGQGALSATHPEATPDVPVLAMHDVPVPTTQDNVETAGGAKASVNGTRASSPAEATPQQSDVARTPVEAPSATKGSPTVAAALTNSVGWVESSRPTVAGMAKPDDSVHPTNTSGTSPQSQSASLQSASNSIVTLAASVGSMSGNPTAAGSYSPQTNVPVAEQLSRAFVTQANVVSHEGRTDFHLRLQPPQLGSVQIHLTAVHDKVSARVVVAQEDTRQLIVGQAHQLREALAESGLVLGNFDVTRDGGGPSQGGNRQAPELPLPPATSSASPTVSAVAKTLQSVPTDGIDILA